MVLVSIRFNGFGWLGHVWTIFAMNGSSLRARIKERLSQCQLMLAAGHRPSSGQPLPIAILHLLSIGSCSYEVHPRFGSCSRSSSKCHRCAVEDRESGIIKKPLFHVVPRKVKANGV